MSAEQITAIGAFRQFQRKQHEQQGLGLGLEICQRLLALYRGKLMLESMQGEHTIVRIMLPLADSASSPLPSTWHYSILPASNA
jgi:signal transduction histidine kinase